MPHRPVVVVHHVGLVGPRLLVGDEWEQEGDRFPDAAAIRKLEAPEIIVWSRQDLAYRRHRIQVEQRIAIRFGAAELFRETAVRCDLVRHQHGLVATAAVLAETLLASEPR